MGFFSWDCPGCGHPALAPHATCDVNGWMVECVAQFPGGRRIEGSYDGYGRLSGQDIRPSTNEGFMPEVWHRVCWGAAGSPAFAAPSELSADQGHFFGPGAHRLSLEGARRKVARSKRRLALRGKAQDAPQGA